MKRKRKKINVSVHFSIYTFIQMRGWRQCVISILKCKKSIRSSEYCLHSSIENNYSCSNLCRKQVTMVVKGSERLSRVTPQKQVTRFFMCPTWPRSDTRALPKQSQSGSRNVQTQAIDEKPNKISQPVLNDRQTQPRPLRQQY